MIQFDDNVFFEATDVSSCYGTEPKGEYCVVVVMKSGGTTHVRHFDRITDRDQHLRKMVSQIDIGLTLAVRDE